MEIQISATCEKGCIEVFFAGAVQAETAVAKYPEILERAVAAGARGVLMDATQINGPVTDAGRIHLINSLKPFAENGLKVALLVSEGRIQDDTFAMTLAANRNILYMWFTEKAEAISWINGSRCS